MGCFDSVLVKCSCGEYLEFQSKADDCMMREYTVNTMPERIAADLKNNAEQCACGNICTIRTGFMAMLEWEYGHGPDTEEDS